jgi:signal transduction histidine kinase
VTDSSGQRATSRHAAPAGPSASSADPYLISTRSPTARQRSLAVLLGLVLLAAYGVAFAYRDLLLPRQDAFVPIANTIIIINDIITAALLATQFSVTRHRALLVLASGFLFKALVLIPHALTFPGAFAPAGLLGANTQTTAWLYQAQHFVWMLAAIGYTMLRDQQTPAPASHGRAAWPVAASFTAVAAAVLLLTFITTRTASLLPPIMSNATHTGSWFQHVGQPLMIILGCGAFLVFWRRPTSVIDLWLAVAVWSWLFESLMQAIVQSRFSFVFYLSRSMGVVSSTFVLIAFLSESLMLHRRLVLATVAREQEREGHRTAIDIIVASLAHELRQPLTAILSNEKAGSRLVAAPMVDRDEMAETFADIRGSVLRANEIIDSVRAMFTASPPEREQIDVNGLAKQAVELLRIELATHRVTVDLALAPELPLIQGHRGQLLEVLLNGLQNGLDSVAAAPGGPRQLIVRTARLQSDKVSINIEDTGGGIDPRVANRLFEPFHTTKAKGMGLGLSICQSIVTAHGGTLTLKRRAPHGAVFGVELPAAAVVAPRSGARTSLPRPLVHSS